MFLKINWNNKTKKISLTADLHNYQKFLEIIKVVTGLDPKNLEIYFFDVENEKLPMNDRLDFDYFLAGKSNDKYRELFVEKKATYSELFLRERDAELQECFKKLDIKMSNMSGVTDPSFVEKAMKESQLNSNFMFSQNKTDTKAPDTGLEDFSSHFLKRNNPFLPNPVSTPLSPFLEISKPDIRLAKVESIITIDEDEFTFKSKCPFLKNKTEEKTKTGSKTIHNCVSCDVCGTENITGKRFKCLVCKDYDICETCEDNNSHNFHPMIRCSESESRVILAKITKKYGKMRKRVEKSKKIGEKVKRFGDKFKLKYEKDGCMPSVESNYSEISDSWEVKVKKIDLEMQQKTEFQTEQINNSITDLQEQKRKEKKELLKFIFGDANNQTLDELASRFEGFTIDEMCEEIGKNNQILNYMYY